VKGSSQQHVTDTLPQQRALIPTEHEPGWAPKLIWTSRRTENYHALTRFISQTCYTEAVPCVNTYNTNSPHNTVRTAQFWTACLSASNSQFTTNSKTLSFCINFREVLAIMHIILHPGIEILNPLVLYRWRSYFKLPGTVQMVNVF